MTRKKLLITGAAGGMGRACARLLGTSRDLVLTDVSQKGLDAFAGELRGDGYSVSVHAGDLCDDTLLTALAGELDGAPFDLIHTAGISPSMGDWRAVIRVNWVGTEKLLRALEPLLSAGSAAVLVASSGGYAVPGDPDIDAILADPLAEDFMAKFGPIAESYGADSAAGVTYAFSKRAVLTTVETRAAAWGAKGARITAISPGMILTPMGRLELDSNPMVQEVTTGAPLGRAATPMDIAFGARFLLSEEANFITGSDLKIDGGAVALAKGPR